jgi:hypothetical protein
MNEKKKFSVDICYSIKIIDGIDFFVIINRIQLLQTSTTQWIYSDDRKDFFIQIQIEKQIHWYDHV